MKLLDTCPKCHSSNTKFTKMFKDSYGKYSLYGFTCLDCPPELVKSFFGDKDLLVTTCWLTKKPGVA